MNNDPSVALFYEAASDWFTRQQDSQHWTEQDKITFEQWLQQDPRHHQAYEEISLTWQAFERMERPASAISDASDAASLTAPAAPSHTRAHRPKAGWRDRLGLPWQAVLGGALTFCVAVGVGSWYWYQHSPQYTQHVQTAQAEQRDITLPDGSVVSLNQNSTLDVQYTPQERTLKLLQGEAFFKVAPQGNHRFVVKSANTQVRVIGTAFNVRLAPSWVYVSVREGVVNVNSTGDRENYSTTLSAGDALRINLDTGLQKASPSTPDRAGAWQSGQLIFKRTPLHEVIDELQSYMTQPIELIGTQIRPYPVSGFANTQRPTDFLDALPQLLPVRVENLDGNAYRISGK